MKILIGHRSTRGVRLKTILCRLNPKVLPNPNVNQRVIFRFQTHNCMTKRALQIKIPKVQTSKGILHWWGYTWRVGPIIPSFHPLLILVCGIWEVALEYCHLEEEG
jgi:hypothetical protein